MLEIILRLERQIRDTESALDRMKRISKDSRSASLDLSLKMLEDRKTRLLEKISELKNLKPASLVPLVEPISPIEVLRLPVHV